MPTLRGELILDQEELNNSPSMSEQTKAQVAIWGTAPNRDLMATVSTSITPLLLDLATGSPYYYKKVRLMRKQPTIKLVRALSIAAMSAAKWSVTCTDRAPNGGKENIETLLSMQTELMDTGLRGIFDFGWQPFEKIWLFDKETMNLRIRKFKPLLQDMTQIMVEAKTGEFAGFKQYSNFIGTSNAIIFNQDVEGTYWYGEGTMQAVEFAYNRWMVTDESASRFDKKVSGAHWVIHYPEGRSSYGGTMMDNYSIANLLLNALQGSGSFVVPRTVLAQTTDLNSMAGEEAWLIELKESSGAAQMSFSQRMQYLDTQIVRAAEFPERSILEGQYGTKAEAGEHADFAIARMDFRNKRFMEQFNKQVVNPMLVVNYGEEYADSVKIEIAPIADDKKELLKTIYTGALSNPQLAAAEYSRIDMEAIRDSLQIPTLEMPEGAINPMTGQPEDSSQYANLHQMLANLNLPGDTAIGSATGAARPIGEQQQTGAM